MNITAWSPLLWVRKLKGWGFRCATPAHCGITKEIKKIATNSLLLLLFKDHFDGICKNGFWGDKIVQDITKREAVLCLSLY